MSGPRDADVVHCAYDGGTGSGSAPLTWAQRFMWDVIQAAGVEPAEFDFIVVREFPVPIAVDAAVDLLRRFVLRHPVLRLAISQPSGGDPVQQVRASGTLLVQVLHGPEPAAADLRPLIAGTTATEVCRPLIVLEHDHVVLVALRISHLATDGGGVRLLTEDLTAVPVYGDAGEVVPTPSPVDLARFETSADGLDVQRRSTDLGAATYAVCPPTMWPRQRRSAERERFWYGELRSSALLAAMDALVRAKRLRRVGILTGAIAAVAAAAAGLDSALLFTISGNRIDPAWRAYPGQLSQEAILHVPLRTTLDETMQAAMVQTMRSLQAARYAPAAMQAVCRAAEWDRGVHFDKLGSAIVLNLLMGESAGRDPAVARPTTFAWTGTTDRENLGLYLDAFEADAEFVLGVRLDTALLSPAEAEAWLRAIEWAVVTDVTTTVTIADVRAHVRAFREQDAADDIMASGCARVVASVTGADAVHVQVVPRDDGRHDHLCYLVNPRWAATPEQAHPGVMAALPAAQPAVAPSRYVIVAEAPTEPADDAAWSQLPVVASGSGR